MKRVGTEKGRKTADAKDLPIPKGGMVRYKGEMVPRLARDTEMDAPIRNMKDKGRGEGLEVVPDKYAKGGSVRGTGCATKGKKFSGVY